ncbi:MAG: lipoprotein-releasing ABC transporter permease subunit [Holosporales bacterium]|jgi:lipoprotein-releasing system permease protein|nr:lipoprotein-releasing ABC transporter permease subunit [Holosporales bacterium]
MIERFIATRYLCSRKNSGFAYAVTLFSFIGIALGVATLIIVTSVMNGFRHELLEKIVGMKGHIVVQPYTRAPIVDYDNVVATIKKADRSVINVIPQTERHVIIIANGFARGALTQSMSLDSLKSKRSVYDNIKAGDTKDFRNHGILIGKRMAESFGLDVGDSVKLFIPDGVITPFGSLPKDEVFTVAGIFEVGMSEYDKNIVIMPLETGQQFFNDGNGVSQIEVFVSDAENVKAVSERVALALGRDFSVLDWQHSDASIFHAVVVEKNVMTLILSIIVLVAMFNIISGLTMLTNSKVRDIAILRTIGATRRSISRIFLLIGATVGILGTGLGVTLGLAVSLNIDRIKNFLEGISNSNLFSEEIYFLSKVPSMIDWGEVTCIVLLSLVLSLLAALYPARKAAKLDPVEALRN